MDLQEKLLAAFDVEHREDLAKIRAFLIVWAHDPEHLSPNFAGEIAEAFRSAHSLKGAARVVDLKTVTEVAHALESLFAMLQSGKKRFRPDLSAIISRALNTIEDTVSASRSGQELPPIDGALQAIQDWIDDKKPALTLASEPTPLAPLEIPSQAVVPKALPRVGRSTFDTMRLSAEHFDRLMKTASEVISFSRSQDEKSLQLKDMNQALRSIEKEWAIVQKHSVKYLRRMTTDPDILRLVKYLSFVETETRSLGRQLRSLTVDQKNDSLALRSLGEQLQVEVQSARLIPASEVYDSFSKMMRDLAKDEGKDLEFILLGRESEADRVVLQALKDPLMHILRNALSHGIEGAEERKKSGKPPSGTITLSIDVQSRTLHIAISDDGRGINFERVRSIAIEKGLIAATEVYGLTEDKLTDLLFHPGFSTAATITEISGRGVGLSVVKEAITKLQGEVTIASKQGAECRFLISVPLSLSSNRLLLVTSQNQSLAFPTHSIESVMRVKREGITTVEGRPVTKVKETFVPVIALSKFLAMSDAAVKTNEGCLSLCILKQGNKRLALAVDGFFGEREGLIKDLGPPLSKSKRFSGGLILDGAKIALVINPHSLFESFESMRVGPPLEVAQHTEVRARLRILVVDDSFTTRILEKSILEAMGYRVDVAIDGVEALSFLQTNQVDLIISDVEMPRMDGLTLLQNVKSNPRLAGIPVIIVSSRNESEDQERGLELGANAYLPKQEFNQKSLLETIRQVI